MRIRVLGSAAGGGLPQWNCGCANCRDARAGAADLKPRSQESLALSADGASWFLVNASPEVRAQIESFPPLWPRAPRHSPLAGILLSNGDLDHCLGLLSLRESHPLTVYATEAVRRGFCDGNVLYRTLERFAGQVTWRRLDPGVANPLLTAQGEATGLEVTAVPAPGKRPVHLEGLGEPSPEDNVGFMVRDLGSGASLAYFPAVGARSAAVEAALVAADCVFFDGTFWSSDELPAGGLGNKRAEDMAHWPVGGDAGSLAFLAGLPARRRILIHLNNSNPLLREGSAAAVAAAAAGVQIADDGMELVL